jgi:sarcosine oxidase subunit beta
MRVAVVGGGIIGLASEYYLAKRDIDITVFEKNAIGSGSSGRANGGIRTQFTSKVSVALSQESIAVWERFEETFGVDIEYRRPGYLFLARTTETANQLRENVAVQNDHGVSSKYLTPAEASEHCLGLYADRYVGATYSPTDGFADPHLALQGFSKAATAAGVLSFRPPLIGHPRCEGVVEVLVVRQFVFETRSELRLKARLERVESRNEGFVVGVPVNGVGLDSSNFFE